MINKKSTLFFFMLYMIAVMTGCSRYELNTQIAECIGTLGMYENNEPVETPKMKAEHAMKESKDEIEKQLTTHVDKARTLADSYDYSGALEELSKIDEEYQDDERVISAKIEYQRRQGLMVNYSGPVAHFSVGSLLYDKDVAFNDPDMMYYYNNWSLTTDEFKKILQQLYENNYILMDVHDLVVEIENSDGTTSFATNSPLVPDGKKPIILSFTEANYYSKNDGYGFSDKMVLNDRGEVKNEYTDPSGITTVGNYDVIPIVNEFVDEHPDFSLRGARGIISLTGYAGVFGYGIETGADTITEIADKLKSQGWQFACHGYSGDAMDTDMDENQFVEDMENWSKKVGSLVGSTDLLIYPYGGQLTPGLYKHQWLLENGYRFFFSLWSTYEYRLVYSDYVDQSRRTLDGYNLHFYGDTMTDYFDYKTVLDSGRPSFE